MKSYEPLSNKVRATAAVASILVTAMLLGTQLSLFDRVATDGAMIQAKANAAVEQKVLAERSARAARRG
jgi:hypothetical protein